MTRALKLTAIAALATLLFPACSSIEGDNSPSRMLIPAKQLNVSPSLQIPAEAIVAAGIIYFIVDPLAPNWKVAVEPVGQHRYRMALTMKRFITGGEGEAAVVVKRAAEKLRKEGGYSEFALVEFSEGIESNVLIAQRLAYAVVELR